MADRKTPPRARAKYVKPAVRTYRIYEQKSLGCGKVGGMTPVCRASPKAS